MKKERCLFFYKNFLVKRFTNVESIVVVSAKASFSFCQYIIVTKSENEQYNEKMFTLY